MKTIQFFEFLNKELKEFNIEILLEKLLISIEFKSLYSKTSKFKNGTKIQKSLNRENKQFQFLLNLKIKFNV